MKKNILTVIIAAASVINLILLIVITFAVVPAMNKTNTLITKVASVIDLEIDSQNKEEEQYSYDDLETMELTYTSKQTINLKMDPGDSKSHFALIESVTVFFNTEADKYSDVKAAITKSAAPALSTVKDMIYEYSFKNISEKTICERAVKELQKFYDSKCIVRVSLGGFLCQ